MTAVQIAGDELVVTMQGLDRLWSLRRRIVVPLAHVRGATADPGMHRAGPWAFRSSGSGNSIGVRSPGTYVPRVVVAGTYVKDGERTFWNLRERQEPVVVELTGEPFARLVLGVDDARATAERIEQALSRR